jgi:hypothetical protein
VSLSRGADLRSFLERANAAGRKKLALFAPGQRCIYEGELHADSANELEQLCEADARDASSDSEQVYELAAQAEGQYGKSTLRLPVKGGSRPKTEHTVDPERVNSTAAALGHALRCVSDLTKQVILVSNSQIEAARVARQGELDMWKALREKNDEWSLARLGLELEEKKTAGWVSVAKEGVAKLPEAIRLLTTKKTADAKDEGDTVLLNRFRKGMSIEQHTKLVEMLGDERYQGFLLAETPQALAELVYGWADKQAVLAHLTLILDKAQQMVIGPLITPHLRAIHERESKKKGEPDGGAAPAQAAAE